MRLYFVCALWLTPVWAASKCSLKAAPTGGARGSAGSGSGTASGSASTNSGAYIAAAWYAAWHSSDFTLSDITWSSYSSMIYAFATTTSDVNTLGLASSDEELLPQFVQTAQKNDVNAILSIGGWGGSQYFSSAVGSATNRTAFAKTVMAAVNKYGLDGVEFDWEYPAKQGEGCNIVAMDDSANFLAFLKELRTQDGADSMLVSAAVSLTPFIGSDGQPMSDVSAFAEVLDTIEVMDYDVWGSWSSTVGPNAPLYDDCAPEAEGSAASALTAWTGAGFPASQIILGVASYGHSFSVTKSSALLANGSLALYPSFNSANQPAGDKWDSTADGSTDSCGDEDTVGGVFDFWGLVDGDFLDTSGAALMGIDYIYDECSQTPFVYNTTTQVMVSYDDMTSFAAKGQWIQSNGLAGFAMWEAGGDYKDILLNAISSGIGIDKTKCSGS
ncbi:unnamed protein product [Peniophora sp. CBMAI 1063]|nr:unnamed protein product [Peniophora sp. CBMAI 1063]